MNSLRRLVLLCAAFGLALFVDAFTTPTTSSTFSQRRVAFPSVTASPFCGQSTSSSALQATPLTAFPIESTTTTLSATTLDPSTFLSDVLGGFINSNLILAVPIVVGLAIASLIAFAIVSYANPAEPEDD